MIKVEHIEVYGWETAIRGMRNPLNSWDKSDSQFDYDKWCMGNNDLTLMKKLCKAGTDHRKFMRMINVTMDITAPLYWWKEFDTYKVGTVANSCSTMHKIQDKEFTIDDFSCEHIEKEIPVNAKATEDRYALACDDYDFSFIFDAVINNLNIARQMFIETKDKRYWWQMIQLLPSSYNQRRTVQLNYEVLANMYHSRKSHKLDCWVDFCKEIEKLPYFKELVIDD